jgi:spore coat polysaccharide biosynthesis protein SpsF
MSRAIAIAIIQARMSSTRFPGKVLKVLAGKPMIWHVYQRALSCCLVDKVVVATSNDRSDDALVYFCQENDLNIFRGDLDNVLSRFFEILKHHSYPYFVRITGDCPLIWPEFIDQQIMALSEFDGDVTWLKNSNSCLEGQGAHSARSLIYVNDKTSDPEDYEHVGSKYLAENPTEFKIVEMNIPDILLTYNYRLTVDEEKDYQLMDLIYNNLYDSKPVDFIQALRWLDKHPDISDINEGVIHKRLNVELSEKKRLWEKAPKVGVYKWKKF